MDLNHLSQINQSLKDFAKCLDVSSPRRTVSECIDWHTQKVPNLTQTLKEIQGLLFERNQDRFWHHVKTKDESTTHKILEEKTILRESLVSILKDPRFENREVKEKLDWILKADTDTWINILCKDAQEDNPETCYWLDPKKNKTYEKWWSVMTSLTKSDAKNLTFDLGLRQSSLTKNYPVSMQYDLNGWWVEKVFLHLDQNSGFKQFVIDQVVSDALQISLENYNLKEPHYLDPFRVLAHKLKTNKPQIQNLNICKASIDFINNQSLHQDFKNEILQYLTAINLNQLLETLEQPTSKATTIVKEALQKSIRPVSIWDVIKTETLKEEMPWVKWISPEDWFAFKARFLEELKKPEMTLVIMSSVVGYNKKFNLMNEHFERTKLLEQMSHESETPKNQPRLFL